MIDFDSLRPYIVYIVQNVSLEQWRLASLVNLKKEYVKITTILNDGSLNDGSALFDIADCSGNDAVTGRIWFNDRYIILGKNGAVRSLLYNGWPEGIDTYRVYERKVRMPEVPKGILKIPSSL